MQHLWPRHFTEVRSLIPDGGDMLACIGAAGANRSAALWRYNGHWAPEYTWPDQSRVLDAVRFNGALYAALGSQGAQIARDGEIVRSWPGWRMVRRLIVHQGELWAFLMLRVGSDQSAVWRSPDGESWREHPFDAPRGVYQTAVFQEQIHVGTLGPPVRFATLDGTLLHSFDAAEIESFTEHEGSLYFTVGTRPRQTFIPPVWSYNGTLERLPHVLPWRIANNFNASCIHAGALHVSSAGRYVWPSVWRREGAGWTRIARWPTRRGQWIYDMLSVNGSLLAAFAGTLGAAQIVEVNRGGHHEHGNQPR